jgi:hypothetical protein
VQAIIPDRPRPASIQNFGIWVVLPEPVSPVITTTGCFRIAATISSRRSTIGRPAGYKSRGIPVRCFTTIRLNSVILFSDIRCFLPGYKYPFSRRTIALLCVGFIPVFTGKLKAIYRKGKVNFQRSNDFVAISI